MVDTLLELLDLEQLDPLLFRGESNDLRQARVFGGQVVAQALVAAGRTVPPDRTVHSLHAYFVLPGDTKVPLLLHVDPIRDGGSFATRRVSVVQHGRPIFHLAASFHRPEVGLEHQRAVLDAPDPLTLPTPEELLANHDHPEPWFEDLHIRFPVELRFADPPPMFAGRDPQDTRQRMWFRSTDPLGDDPLMHTAAVAYATDLSLLTASLLTHDTGWGRDGLQGASLDHAVWFHAPVRADEWILYETTSPWAGAGRGIAHGSMFSRDGRLIASVVQEGLIRKSSRKPTAPS